MTHQLDLNCSKGVVVEWRERMTVREAKQSTRDAIEGLNGEGGYRLGAVVADMVMVVVNVATTYLRRNIQTDLVMRWFIGYSPVTCSGVVSVRWWWCRV